MVNYSRTYCLIASLTVQVCGVMGQAHQLGMTIEMDGSFTEIKRDSDKVEYQNSTDGIYVGFMRSDIDDIEIDMIALNYTSKMIQLNDSFSLLYQNRHCEIQGRRWVLLIFSLGIEGSIAYMYMTKDNGKLYSVEFHCSVETARVWRNAFREMVGTIRF